mmetsp:Transcript_47026/g.110794  ORF Transcript_47026/g.110794 Transcript_47026/m.110794 type:complete len:252 (+) Transcript_47026:320-1075(+)
MNSSSSISSVPPAMVLNMRKICISVTSLSNDITPSLNSSSCSLPSPLLSMRLNASASSENCPCKTSRTSSSAISSTAITSASRSYFWTMTGCLREKEQQAMMRSAGFHATSVTRPRRCGILSRGTEVSCSPVSVFHTNTCPSSLPDMRNLPSGERSQRIWWRELRRPEKRCVTCHRSVSIIRTMLSRARRTRCLPERSNRRQLIASPFTSGSSTSLIRSKLCRARLHTRITPAPSAEYSLVMFVSSTTLLI